MNKNVVILWFRGRNNGNCSKIAEFICDHYNRTNVHMCSIDAETMPPCGNCDYQCLKKNKACPNLTAQHKAVFDAVTNATITYMIIPNYCGFPCANFFAFNERSVGYFNKSEALMERYMSSRKRFVVVSNTESQQLYTAMEQHAFEPEILYLKCSEYGKKSINGDLMDSAAARAELRAFLELDDPL